MSTTTSNYFLPSQGEYNNLSDEVRDKIQKKLDSILTKKMRRIGYKFNISNPNPDPTPGAEQIVWPFLFKVPKAQYDFRDKNTVTKVAMLKEYDKENPRENKFHKIAIEKNNEGRYWIDFDNNDRAFDEFAYLELHPDHLGGLNEAKNGRKLFSRIDQIAESKAGMAKMTVLGTAIFATESMSDQDIRDFACAQDWDETEDISILQYRVKEMAFSAPEAFVEILDKKNVAYSATIKRAELLGIIEWNPSEKKWSWGHDNKAIAMLSHNVENRIAGFVEWLQTSKNGDQVYDSLKKMISGK